MKYPLIAAFAASAALAVPAAAHDYTAGDLIVGHPMAFETATTAQTAAGYLTITNAGTQADRLIGVEAEFPRVEIHTTEMDGDMARMMKLDGVDLPPGAEITLAPGGMHVMFMGLGGDPFEVGEEIPATLLFENAGPLAVVFHVEERTPGGHDAMDHSGH